MKNTIIVLAIALNCLSSCAEDETGPIIHEKITSERIAGTWLIVSEERSSDHWTQSDENGIITDWQIVNPFGGEMSVSSIKFNTDQTFFWGVDQLRDWDHFISTWNDVPKDRWDTFKLSNDGTLITLYTRFEYVGIIKADTAAFQVFIDQDDQLILENEEVRFKLAQKTGPY